MRPETDPRRRRAAQQSKVPAAAKTPMAKVVGSGTGTIADRIKGGEPAGKPKRPARTSGTTSVIPSWSPGTPDRAVPQRVPSQTSISKNAVWPSGIPGTGYTPALTNQAG